MRASLIGAVRVLSVGSLLLLNNSHSATLDAATVGNYPFVKNGLAAKPSDFPEVVAVEVDDVVRQVKRICTGVVVRDDVVITAAHCAYGKIKPLRVISGTNAAVSATTPSQQVLKVTSYKVMDPQATSAGRRLMGSDLMILFLDGKLSSPVFPIAVPSLAALTQAKALRIVGFGDDGKGGIGKKLFADVPLEVARCDQAHSVSGSCGDGEGFLKRADGKFDACPGDSGGPAYVLNDDGKYRLVGLLSRSSSTVTRCGGGTIVTLLDGDRLNFLTKNGVAESTSRTPIRPSAPPPCIPPLCAFSSLNYRTTLQ